MGFSLKNYNTFGIDVKADQYIILKHADELAAIDDRQSALILGGGSNVLLTSDIHRTVIINQTKGIEKIHQDDTHIWLRIASGENWHELVMYCVDHGYGGIENLSLIPGSVGAAPMQNIGAYGVEIKDVLENVVLVDLATLETVIFRNEDCHFGYRDSVFKHEAKGKYFVSQVTLKLTTTDHKYHMEYGAIAQILEKKGIIKPGLKELSDAVIAIRQSKLPDPKEIGNSGSFFKNPVIPKLLYDSLLSKYPLIPSYPISENEVKVPAAWLIESLGWKGKRVGNTGSHKDQALVLVNYGNAKGAEVEALSNRIKASVKEQYGIDLETEVNIIKG